MDRDPVNILVIGTKWPPETFLQRLIEGLSFIGVKVTVATADQPSRAWLQEGERDWQSAPDWDLPIWKRMAHLARMLTGYLFLPRDRQQILHQCVQKIPDRLARLKAFYKYYPLLQHKWDVIYFPWNMTANAYLPILQSSPAKVIISCRGAQINVAPHNPARADVVTGYREAFKRATVIHCVSQDILNEAMLYGLDPAKARVIRPAVDPDYFSPIPTRMRPPRFTILTTGSLIWRKGIEYTLLTLKHLLQMGVDAELHIAGDGPEQQRVLFTVQDLGLEDRVCLHGRLPTTEVRGLLRRSDAFLLSSLSEGISNAVLEAMSCGLPVVTTDCGGMREAVTDGVEGFVVPVRDPNAAAIALRRLAEDETLRKEMGCAGRERVLRNFSLAEQVTSFAQMIRETR